MQKEPTFLGAGIMLLGLNSFLFQEVLITVSCSDAGAVRARGPGLPVEKPLASASRLSCLIKWSSQDCFSRRRISTDVIHPERSLTYALALGHIYLELFFLRREFVTVGQVKKLMSVFTCSAVFTCQCLSLVVSCVWMADRG